MINETYQVPKGDRVQRPYSEKWETTVGRLKQSLENMFKRKYPDNWREKLAEFVR